MIIIKLFVKVSYKSVIFIQCFCRCFEADDISAQSINQSLFDCRVGFAVNVLVRRQTTGRRGVGTPEELIGDSTRLPQPRQHSAVHRGGVVADGVLSTEEHSGRVLHHVVALARVPGDNGSGQNVIVVPRRP